MSRASREKAFFNQLFAGYTGLRDMLASRTSSISRLARSRFVHVARELCRDADVLDYGCGRGELSFDLIAHGARSVTGIDFSEVPIEQARSAATAGDVRGVRFLVMDATATDFADEQFDVVVGKAILHHLDLERSLTELRRLVRPEGIVVLLEPLGHNPLLRLFRWLTPSLRTADEQPLRMPDLDVCRRHFASVDLFHFNLFTLLLLVVPRRLPGYYRALSALEWCDRRVLAAVPFLRRYTWNVVIGLSGPRTP